MALIFQYGSNCSVARFNSKGRLDGAARVIGLAKTVEPQELTFTIYSDGNACAASTLSPRPGTLKYAYGVLYEVPDDRTFGRRTDCIPTIASVEGNRYKPIEIDVEINGETRRAWTWVAKEEFIVNDRTTSVDYVGHIVNGLREQGAPEEYVRTIIETATSNNPAAAEEFATL